MIKKNIKWSKAENVTVAEFGHGTVAIVTGITHDGNQQVVGMKSQDPKPINFENEHGNFDFDQWNPELMLCFSNPESVDVLIETLIEVKANFKIANFKNKKG